MEYFSPVNPHPPPKCRYSFRCSTPSIYRRQSLRSRPGNAGGRDRGSGDDGTADEKSPEENAAQCNTESGEQKEDMRQFNGGHSTAKKQWYTGGDGQRREIDRSRSSEAKDESKRMLRALRTDKRRVYDQRLNSLNPMWKKWVRKQLHSARPGRADGEVLTRSSLLPKLIRRAEAAQASAKRLEDKKMAMARSLAVLKEAVEKRNFAGLIQATSSPGHRSNIYIHGRPKIKLHFC